MSYPFDPALFLVSGPLVPLVMDPATERVLWVGPQSSDLLGYELADWTRETFWDEVVLEEDRTEVRDIRARGVVEGADVTVEYRVRAANGAVVWLTEVGRVAPFGDETRLHAYLMDVSDRKMREVALWRREERSRSMLLNAPDAMVVTDLEGRIVDMNDQAVRLFQYDVSEVVGSSLTPMVSERFRQQFTDIHEGFDDTTDRRSLVVGKAFSIESRDGSEIPVELGMSVVQASDGSVQILNTFRDLTARRRVEARVRSHERSIRTVDHVLPAMVCLVDRNERFRFVNEAYAMWNGWQRHQMEGRQVREVVRESVYEDLAPMISAALEGEASHVRADVVDPDGVLRFLDVSFVPQFDEGDAVDGFVAVFFDVGTEVEAEHADRVHREELARIARVATLGELAASIAHELNQPLSAVVANANAASRFLAADPPDLREVRDALTDVAEDAARAGDVIASMRQLLERGEVDHHPLDLRSVLVDVAELLRSEAIMRGVSLEIPEAGPVDLRVAGHRGQLTQVFLNLVMNAIDSTCRLPAPPRTVSILAHVQDGVVEVQVCDNGAGLPADDVEKLFEPFVSGRPDGLGMGLTISRSIAETHGGQLTAERPVEGGARLCLRLPLLEDTPDGDS